MKPNLLHTYTGKYIDVFNPNPDDICIDDIAHSLAYQCRFAGHIHTHFSVAQHSVLVADFVSEEHKLQAILHDASEAYLVDIPRPIKALLPQYLEVEDRLMRVIADKFGFEYPLCDEVKEADDHSLQWEWTDLVLTDIGKQFCLSAEESEIIFLDMYEKFRIFAK